MEPKHRSGAIPAGLASRSRIAGNTIEETDVKDADPDIAILSQPKPSTGSCMVAIAA
jgi:hypothetical protein